MVGALILEDVSSDADRARISEMLMTGVDPVDDYMTPERWGTSREAIAGLHTAMAGIDDPSILR